MYLPPYLPYAVLYLQHEWTGTSSAHPLGSPLCPTDVALSHIGKIAGGCSSVDNSGKKDARPDVTRSIRSSLSFEL
jgi:hypothetical protein